jgi:hypothetical protein
MYEMKADVLGIIDAEYLTDAQLKREVDYASLNPIARNDAEKYREKLMVRGFTRTTLPGPVYIPANG